MSDAFVPDSQRWMELETTLHTWRQAHPEATWVEIEAELDRRRNVLRAALLGEVVGDAGDDPACCPHCGGPLQTRGTHTRTLLTQGAQPIPLTRAYQTCPACGAGLFPRR